MFFVLHKHSSFRMAHMFPDCVGEVDVVSDAENIKKLLKIPYSKGPVSVLWLFLGLCNYAFHNTCIMVGWYELWIEKDVEESCSGLLWSTVMAFAWKG